jgi:hypothetical protein
MPNIDLHASHEFWKNYEDPMIFRVIAFMESVESWTLDGNPELEEAIKTMGDALDKLTRLNSAKKNNLSRSAPISKHRAFYVSYKPLTLLIQVLLQKY